MYQNFVKDVPRVPKCVPRRWGLTPNHFLMGSKMKSCIIYIQMGDPETIGSVPNFMNDVPNFVNDVSNFVKDMPRVPKFISRWRMTFNHYLRVLK